MDVTEKLVGKKGQANIDKMTNKMGQASGAMLSYGAMAGGAAMGKINQAVVAHEHAAETGHGSMPAGFPSMAGMTMPTSVPGVPNPFETHTEAAGEPKAKAEAKAATPPPPPKAKAETH